MCKELLRNTVNICKELLRNIYQAFVFEEFQYLGLFFFFFNKISLKYLQGMTITRLMTVKREQHVYHCCELLLCLYCSAIKVKFKLKRRLNN